MRAQVGRGSAPSADTAMSMSCKRCGPASSSSKRVDLHAIERLDRQAVGVRELPEDAAASLQLLPSEGEVLAAERGHIRLVGEFVDDHRQRRERRAEFVRRRCRQAVELREVLGAGKHQLGRGEGFGELSRLAGDLAAIDRYEHRADRDSEQKADRFDGGWIDIEQALLLQRHPPERQHASAKNGERQQLGRLGPALRHRGNHRRRQQEHRKRIGQAAGEIQHDAELADVEGQDVGRGGFVETPALGHPKTERGVEGDQRPDADRARGVGKFEPQQEAGHQQRRDLAGRGDPSQSDERPDAHAPSFMAEVGPIHDQPPLPSGPHGLNACPFMLASERSRLQGPHLEAE